MTHQSITPELLVRLGGVPAERVEFEPVPGTATVADLVAAGKPACDLVDGTLVRPVADWYSSLLVAHLLMPLWPASVTPNRGIITNTCCPFELWPGRVRTPDLAFISWDRLPGRRMSNDPVPAVVPNLVVQFRKPGHTATELVAKRADWFRAGVELLWLVDARERTVWVYRSPDEIERLTAADTLTGDPVLPGFALKLADLFAELDRHG